MPAQCRKASIVLRTKLARTAVVLFGRANHVLNSFRGSDQMRRVDDRTSGLFGYVSPEERIGRNDSLRAIVQITDNVLWTRSRRVSRRYTRTSAVRRSAWTVVARPADSVAPYR